MKLAHIWSNYPSNIISAAVTADTTVGFRFRFREPGVVSSIMWRRVGFGSANSITHLGLWDTVTEAFVFQTSAPSDDVLGGYQWHDLPSPAAVTDARDYVLMARYPAGSRRAVVDLTAGASGLVGDAFDLGYPFTSYATGTAWPAVPASADTQYITPLDVAWSIVAPDQSSATTPYDVAKQLQDWLTPVTASETPDQNNAGYIPRALLKDLTAADPSTAIANLSTQVASFRTALFNYLNTNVGTNADFSTPTPMKVIGALRELIELLSAAFTIISFLRDLWPAPLTPTTMNDTMTDHRQATEPTGETLPAYIAEQVGAVLNALGRGTLPGQVPTVTAEEDWSGSHVFAEPADFYIIDVQEVPPRAMTKEWAGVTVYDKIGWVAAIGEQDGLEYDQRLSMGRQVVFRGRPLHGLLIAAYPLVSGHVTAFRYE